MEVTSIIFNNIPQGWIPLKDAVKFVNDNLMTKTKFTLDNWDYKYTNIRVDMRTGHATIQAGNKRTQDDDKGNE